MKVAIIGGHLTPALAVIQKLPQNTEVIYIGRKHPVEGDAGVSLEYHTITGMGIPFVAITTAKLQRRLTRHTLPSLAKLPKGLSQSFKILKKYQPDIILSFGGYVSVPVCFAAYLLKIPIVIHEQTTQAGMANKLIAFFAKKVCISFESSKPFFPKEKVIITGNPIPEIRPTKDIVKYRKKDTKVPLVVISGGSQGSHVINQLIGKILPGLLEKYQLIHQTGDSKEYNDFDHLEKIKNSLPSERKDRYVLTKFIHPYDIEEVYRQADLVVSRSGINTVLMLLLLHKPALFIPLPYGQHNEQLKNAKMFKEAGLGEIGQQQTLTPEILFDKIQSMMEHVGSYINKKPELIAMHTTAAEKIVELVKSEARNPAIT